MNNGCVKLKLTYVVKFSVLLKKILYASIVYTDTVETRIVCECELILRPGIFALRKYPQAYSYNEHTI